MYELQYVTGVGELGSIGLCQKAQRNSRYKATTVSCYIAGSLRLECGRT
jgi:hypothetical protein